MRVPAIFPRPVLLGLQPNQANGAPAEQDQSSPLSYVWPQTRIIVVGCETVGASPAAETVLTGGTR
jgi:hypothetical protein